MLIIQHGDNVYGVDQETGRFKQLPLTYSSYPAAPTPDSLNQCTQWLLDFLKRSSLPYTFLINEETSKGLTAETTIVYADIVQGSEVKKENLALYTIANAITTGATQSLEQTLYEELT